MAHQFDGLVMVPNCDKNVPGLLMAAAPDEAEKLEQELQNAGLPARIVGTITEPGEVEIFVRG